MAIPFEEKNADRVVNIGFRHFSLMNRIVHTYSLPESKQERKGRTTRVTGE